MIKTIIVGVLILGIAFYSIRKLIKVLRGEESGCSCSGCNKKESCSKEYKKN